MAFSNRGNLAKVSVFPTLGHERSVFKPTWRQLTWLCAYARHTRGIAHWVTLTLAIDTGPYDTLTQKSTPWPELLRLSRHTRQEGGGGGGRETEIEKKEALSRTMLRYFTERYSDFRVTKRSRWNLYYYYYYCCCFFFFSLFLFFFLPQFFEEESSLEEIIEIIRGEIFFLVFLIFLSRNLSLESNSCSSCSFFFALENV